MLKKIFMAIGILVTGLFAVGITTAVIGHNRDAPANMETAVAAMKDLSHAWRADDLKPHFARVALEQVDFVRAQQAMNNMSALGELKVVKTWRQTAWRASIGSDASKEATIELDAEFENGEALVTVKLADDGGRMKVLHINIVPAGPLKPRQQA